jgi:release factor glutamine methyltransferase
MTFSEARTKLEQTLTAAGIKSAKAEARWLLEHLFFVTPQHNTLLQQGRFIPLSNVRLELTPEQEKLLNRWTKRRTEREPLQHILGVAPFYGLELIVNRNVLIPRPETERLVELVLEHVKEVPNPNILDVGTGSGAVALALKYERPDAVVTAVDISSAALVVAKQNAEKYKLAVDWLESDLLHHQQVQTFAKTCDVLVANLPYLPKSDKKMVSPEVLHDPDLALYAGEDGLDIFRRLEQQAFELVASKTFCFFELDPRNIEAALNTCQRWKTRDVLEDLVGRKRFLKLRR